jgi:hypothetical protein
LGEQILAYKWVTRSWPTSGGQDLGLQVGGRDPSLQVGGPGPGLQGGGPDLCVYKWGDQILIPVSGGSRSKCAVKDNAAEDNAAEDNATEDNVTEDNAAEDSAAKDNTAKFIVGGMVEDGNRVVTNTKEDPLNTIIMGLGATGSMLTDGMLTDSILTADLTSDLTADLTADLINPMDDAPTGMNDAPMDDVLSDKGDGPETPD